MNKTLIYVDQITAQEVLFIETEWGWVDATGHFDVIVVRVELTDCHLDCQAIIG